MTISLFPNLEPGFDTHVGMSGVPGYSAVHKFGSNPSIDAATDEDIWDAGDDYTYQTSAQALEIVSSDVDDADGGDGARRVRIFGLDGNYDPQEETVILNGQTAVDLVGTYLRVFRAYVLEAGTAEDANQGTLTIRLDGAGATQAIISPGVGQTLMAIYTIPNGKTGYLRKWYATPVGQATGEAIITVRTREEGMAFRVREQVTVSNASTGWQYEIPYLVRLPEHTDIKMRANVSNNGSQIDAGFELLLVNN